MTWYQADCLSRSAVKYSQCGIVLTQASARLRPRGEHGDFAGARLHVDFRAQAVVCGKFVQRHLPAHAQSPLVHLRERAHGLEFVFRQAQETGGDDLALLHGERQHGFAGVGKNRGVVAEAVCGAIHHGEKRDTTAAHSAPFRSEVRALGSLRWRKLDARDIKSGQVVQALLRRDGRHPADVDHHDAGGEPHDNEQADGDAEVAMRNDHAPAEKVAKRLCHGLVQLLAGEIVLRGGQQREHQHGKGVAG